MADEIAGVGIRVDTDGITGGIKALDALADQGPKVEKSLQGVEASAAKTGKSISTLGQGSAEAGLAKVGKAGRDAAADVGKLGDSAARTAASVKQIDRSGTDTARAIAGVGNAVKSLVTSNEAVVASIRGLTTAESAHIAKLQEEARQMRATIAERDKYIAQAQGMLAASKEIASGIGAQVASLKQVQGASAQASDSMLSMVRTGVGAFLGGAVVSGAKSAAGALFEASAAAERLRTTLNFSTGGRSAQEIEYLRQITGRLGLEFDSTARAYGKFQAAARGTSLEGQKARDVFESIAKASAVMGLTSEESTGALLALQQMLSKGTVQAEELRGQLGERLPVAFRVAAQAMGVTQAELGKMLEQGQILADDFLPRFARALNEDLGSAADNAADRLDAATNKFSNAWQRLKEIVGDAGVSKAIKGEINALADDVTVFGETMEKVGKSGGGFLTQIAAASGVEAGRLAFGLLNNSANLLNGTINTLTGNVFGLRTDLAVLPDVFKTNAQQAAALAQELARAEADYARLKAQGADRSESFWVRNQLYNLGEYIKKLKEAKAERDNLTEKPAAYSPARDSQAASEAEARRIDGIRAAMEKVQMSLSGVKDSFYKDLAALKAGYDAGLIKLADYQQQVAKLIEQSGGGKASAAAVKEVNKELQEQKKLVLELAGLNGSFAEDWDRLGKLYSRRAISVEQLEQAQAKLLAKQPAIAASIKAEEAAWLAAGRAEAEAIAQRDKTIEGLRKGGDAVADQIQRLKEEEQAAMLAAGGNISLAQAIQQVAIARLQEAKTKTNDTAAIAAIDREIEKRKELIGVLSASESRKALDELLDPSRAETFGEALAKAFDGAGNSLAKLGNVLADYGRQQEAFARRQAAIEMARASDPARALRAQLKLNEDSQRSQVALYAGMTSAAKGFFAEGSKGYKALEAAENAWRAYQLASDLIKGTSAAAVAVANQAQGDPYTAWPRMAAMAAAMAALGFAVTGGFSSGATSGGDGRPVNTGTGTVFGDASAQSESIARSIDRLADTAGMQLTTQSGMLAALRNIEANIGGLTGLVLRRNAGAGDVAAQFGVNVGTSVATINRADLNLTLAGAALGGPIGAAIGFAISKIPIVDKITNALFGKTTRITGNGLFAGPQDLASVVAGGLNLQDYADINTSRKFFGIKYSNSNSTQYQASDPVLAQQFGLVLSGFYDAIKMAAGPLDQNLQIVTDRLDRFVVDIGKIDLRDLTGEQIQERLTAVLGASADSIATAAIPGLQAFQNVGEGYFETVVRVASGVEQAEAALELLGIQAINFTDITRKQADVAAEILRQSIVGFEGLDGSLSGVGAIIQTLDGSAEDLAQAYRSLVDTRDVLIAVGENGDALTAAMIRGAGGLDALKTSLGDYFENFFTEDERRTAGRQQLQGQFDRLGLGELPTTREAFRAIVEGVDTSSEAGQKLYAQLIGLSGAFADLVDATVGLGDNAEEAARRMAEAGQRVLADLAGQRDQLEVQLLRAQGNTGAADARARELALAQLTNGLTPADAAAAAAAFDFNAALQAQIATLQEATRAAEAAAAAEQQRIRAVETERTGLETRLLQAQGDTAALRARELASIDASNRALLERIFALEDAAAAEQRAQAVAAERSNLEQQIFQLTGDTAALRALELAGLDASNRALQERIYALQDAAAAEAEAEQRAQAIAAERTGLERQILQLTGNTAALRALELAGLDESNRALQERIYALQDAAAAEQAANAAAQEAARAAEQLRQSWASTAKSLTDEARSIRQQIAGEGGAESLAQAQARFTIGTAQALAGDQAAAGGLPALAQAMLRLAEGQVGSFNELQVLRARTAASLESTGQSLSAQFAQAPMTTNDPGVIAELSSLRAETRELRGLVAALTRAAERTASAVEGNQSIPILVEIAE